MSILTAASSQSVIRGFEYYKDDRILSCEKIDDDIYEGKIAGSGKNVYTVILDVNHPRKSMCNCPYAEGTAIVCKHEVALYFYLFPNEAQDYEDWLSSDSNRFLYDDEEYDDDDEYEDYDYCEDYDRYEERYGRQETIPYCYDELLENHINKMTIDELKDVVRENLNKDKRNTFFNILKNEYDSYLLNNKEYRFIENLHSKIINYTNIYDYDFTDFEIEILTSYEKTKIKELYAKNSKTKELLDDILLNTELSQYKGYNWIISFYKDRMSEKEKKDYTERLQNTLNSLKHYGIRNSDCKSNVLIAMNNLNNYDVKYLANSLIRGSKYKTYVEYVIKHTNNIDALYSNMKSILDRGHGFDIREAPNLILSFYERYEGNIDKMSLLLNDHSYYNFIFNNSKESLLYLINKGEKNLLEKIEHKIKNGEQLLVYLECNKQLDKMIEVLKKENKPYLYNRYLSVLKDSHGEDLFNYYRNRLYETLNTGMGREIYREAVSNIKQIKKLNDGKNLADSIYREILNSKYNNRPALIEELKNVL